MQVLLTAYMPTLSCAIFSEIIRVQAVQAQPSRLTEMSYVMSESSFGEHMGDGEQRTLGSEWSMDPERDGQVQVCTCVCVCICLPMDVCM